MPSRSSSAQADANNNNTQHVPREHLARRRAAPSLELLESLRIKTIVTCASGQIQINCDIPAECKIFPFPVLQYHGFCTTLRSLILEIDHTDHAILVVCEGGYDFSAGLIAALLMCTGDPVERERREERGN